MCGIRIMMIIYNMFWSEEKNTASYYISSLALGKV